MINKIYKKIRNIFAKKYFCIYYSFYRLFNKKINSKIKEILLLNEKDIFLGSNEQEEQALPGMSKYVKNGWYEYMFGRYLFSIKYIKNKTVLDTACGLGWGSYLISDYPKKITSVDIDEKSLNFAKKQWKNSKIEFKKRSILDLNKLSKIFDVVLSYEVIEHLPFESGAIYIKEVSKVIKSKGIFILSSAFPDKEEDAKKIEKMNKFHLHIYTKKEMLKLLKENGFYKIKFYGNLIISAKKK